MQAQPTGKLGGIIYDRGTSFGLQISHQWYGGFTVAKYGTREAAQAAALAFQRDQCDALKLTKNRWTIEEDVLRVELTLGQTMLLDAADPKARALVEEHTLFAIRGPYTFYAATNMKVNGRMTVVRFHNLYTGFDYVDHINRNGLDNRRANLRQANHTINMRNTRRRVTNTSGITGVGFSGIHGAWFARWREDGKVRSKSFAVSKYGNREAKQMAIAARRSACARLQITTEE